MPKPLSRILVASLGLLLAGCLSAGPSDSPSGNSCTPRPEAVTCGTNAGLTPTLYSMALSGCESLFHTIYFREEVFQPEYPPGVTPGVMVLGIPVNYAGLELTTCKQATFGSEVLENFQLFTFAGGIRNPESDATNVTFKLFLLQAYTNSRSLVENASRAYGLNIQFMDPVQVTKTPVQLPSPSFDYSFSVPGGAQPDYSFRGHMNAEKGAPDEWTTGIFFLNSTKELNHFRLSEKGATVASSGGVVSFGPGSYWKKHSQADTWDFVNSILLDVSGELRFYEGV